MDVINQYEIVLVNLDPTIGSEMKKARPCVVLSPNEMNKFLKTIVVAPLATSSKAYPTRVEETHNATKGWIAIDQIRTINRKRIGKQFEKINNKEIRKVKRVIQEAFVD